jgi:Flp pilus assembly protein TadD
MGPRTPDQCDNQIMKPKVIARLLAAVCLAVPPMSSAQPPAQPQQQAAAMPDPAADLIKQGQQQLREGQHEAALKTFIAAAEKAPATTATRSTAHLQAGVVLDLLGRYDEARKRLAQAIDDAPSNTERDRAVRAMAMSYGFERNCEGAARYAGPLYDRNLANRAFFDAGEVANELARVCLESGSVEQAATWYKRGYDAGLKEEGIKPERRDLWEFRWEHAQARLAARKGQAEDARKHVAAAKAVLDKGTNPEQAPFFPYLVGYVAFYTGDTQTAVGELQKANQNDPFITCLLAQAYEKQGDKAKADELYRKVLTSTAHNPTNAYARPFAKQKLGIK